MTADTARSIVKIRLAKATAIVSLAAGLATTLTPATAADLYSDEPPPPSYGNAYDDPRYADLYGRPPARVETYRQEDRYYEPHAPLPPARVYREYDRYAERAQRGCPSKNEISRQLERDGWRGFHNPQVIDRETATVDAQRPNGRPFRLQVDRCTGQVLSERPLDGPRYSEREGYGPYAEYGRRPFRAY